MNKQTITFTASEQTLTKTGGIEHYASNIVSYIEASFTLGDNWTGYDSIRAVWESGYARIATVLDANNKCIVPAEVLTYKSKVNVNLVGSIVENTVLTDRLTTYPILALTVDADARVDSSETTPVTASQFEQFVDVVRDEASAIQNYTYDSEAWAVGQRAGVDVPSTDETYHNNAKYYADQGATLQQEVTDLKSDLSTNMELLNEFEAELYDSSRTADGYYPAVSGENPGELAPNSSAGTTHWIDVRYISKLIITAQTGEAHNFCFYDSSKNYLFGFVQSMTANEPFEYVLPFDVYQNICYMRAAFYLTEKATFSIKGYSDCYDVESFNKSIGLSSDETIDFKDGFTPNAWSVTSVGTFWMTNSPDMIALRGKKLKSVTLDIQSGGTVLTIRGYDGEISTSATRQQAVDGASVANSNGYDIFKIINATAGVSTYLLDGSDDRVEIIDETLICPNTIGLCKAGDTAKFRFAEVGASGIIYFAHIGLTDNSMKEARLGVAFVANYTHALNLTLSRSNGEEVIVSILPEDLPSLKTVYSDMKMNCLGDSITYGYIPDSGAQMANPYPSLLKDILGLSVCRNYGISGSTLAVNSGNYQPMCQRYIDMDNDADIVLVFGGTNDYGRAVYTPTLGTITDNVNTTVYGALNILCEGLITKYPKALIFLCTPLKRADKTAANGGGYTLEDVANAIREVGLKFGMPVLDLDAKGGFYISNATFRAQYGGNDKLHPNQAFDNEHLAPMIARFIASNI